MGLPLLGLGLVTCNHRLTFGAGDIIASPTELIAELLTKNPSTGNLKSPGEVVSQGFDDTVDRLTTG